MDSNELKSIADSMIIDLPKNTGNAKFKGAPFIELDSTVNFLGLEIILMEKYM